MLEFTRRPAENGINRKLLESPFADNEAQARLYQRLGCQLKASWANGTGNKAQYGSQSHREAIAIAEPTDPEHFCQGHQTEFKQYHRGNSSWYAHKAPDGSWCREK